MRGRPRRDERLWSRSDAAAVRRDGQRRDRGDLRRHLAALPRGGRGRRVAEHRGGGHRPAHGAPRSTPSRPRVGPTHRPPRRRPRGHQLRRASAPRSPPGSADGASSTSTHRSAGVTAPDTPVPFAQPLEDAYVPSDGAHRGSHRGGGERVELPARRRPAISRRPTDGWCCPARSRTGFAPCTRRAASAAGSSRAAGRRPSQSVPP